MIKMYLDDIRTPKDKDFSIVRSFKEATDFIKANGIPNFISFDHDISSYENGIEKTGYDFAKWLIEKDIEKEFSFPENFSFNVHSANPVGKKNIEIILNNYLKFKKGTK